MGQWKTYRDELLRLLQTGDQHWSLLGRSPLTWEKAGTHIRISPRRCNPGTDSQLYLTWASWMWAPEGSSHDCYPPSINKLRSLEVPGLAQGDRSMAVSQMELCMFGRRMKLCLKVEDCGARAAPSSEAHRTTIKGWGWALSWLWILKASLTSCSSLNHLSSLPRVTHPGSWLDAFAHVSSCKFHVRLFVMKRRHNEKKNESKIFPEASNRKGGLSGEVLTFLYILQKWMGIRLTDRIMTFIPSTDFF